MGAEITIEQVDQAVGMLANAAALASMTRADHQACIQATQLVVKYIQQVKTAQEIKTTEAPKE